MKNQLKKIALLLITVAFASCSNDDNQVTVNELEGLIKVKEITNDTHTIELYTRSGKTEQGYNDIKLRIKNNADNQYVRDAQITWMPVMHMTSMSHSCPFSPVEKVTAEGTLYNGYIMFQMAQNETEFWDLKIDYTIAGVTYTATSVVDVPASAKRTVNTFTADGVKYLVAYVDPVTPKVALNNMKIGVWKMQSMMNFPVVDGFTVKIDPRMPSMGNHSSPNNVHATQTTAGDLYNGKLSLTMTGYWKINLQVANTTGTVIKGEEITDTVEASSIYFEIEF